MKKMKIVRASSNVVGVGRQTRSRAGNFLVAVTLTLSGAVLALPLVYAIVNAFKPFDELFIFPPRMYVVNPTWDNFIDLMAMCSNTWVPFTKYLFNSLFTTIVTTVAMVIISAMCAYPLAKNKFPGNKAIFNTIVTALLFVPAVTFLPQYLVIAKLHMIDTYWALILPICCSTFNIIIMRTFFTTTVPDEMIESGKIDGASQLRIFVQLVLPICLPAIATIALFLTFAYWNEWYNASIYLSTSRSDLFPLQFVLVSIEQKIQFLINNANYVSADSQDLPSETMRMAIVVIAVVPVMFSYPFFQKYYISGLTVGAVKG
jgi:ABC-type glycerol-3-phosphate transport system permease component